MSAPWGRSPARGRGSALPAPRRGLGPPTRCR
jgi:hypothetical protein